MGRDPAPTTYLGVIMLLSFSVQNWKVFNQTASLSLMAGSGRRFEHSLHRLPEKYDRRRVLPIAALYGRCASGKTSFVQSIETARAMVLGQSASCTAPSWFGRMNPTTFAVLFIIKDCCYELRFSVADGRIEAEQLVELTSSVAKRLYYRTRSEIEVSEEFGRAARPHFEDCPSDKLLIHQMTLEELPEASKISDWFKYSIAVVQNGRYELPMHGMRFSAEDLEERINGFIRNLDLGFDAFRLSPATNDEVRALSLPEPSNEDKFGSAAVIRRGSARYYVRKIDGECSYFKAECIHSTSVGSCAVPIEYESSSASRIFDISAAAASLLESVDPLVFVFDEIDRGAGAAAVSNLIRKLSSANRCYNLSQLIFTSENPLSFSLSELRRDEVFMLEGSRGITPLPAPANKREKFSLSVYPFADYELCA